MMRKPPFLTFTIVGLGHIGGSLARALKKVFKKQIQIIGVDKNKATLAKAKKTRAFTGLTSSLNSKTTKSSDIVFVCVSVEQIPQVFMQLSKLGLKKGAIITDVGSTKEAILKKAKSSLPRDISFVGGHPIAGTEKSGFDNSDPNLFRDRPFLVSGAVGSKSAPKTVGRIWKKLGCKVFTVSPKEHDKIFSYLSHFPHVLSFGLNKIVAEKLSSKTVSNYGGDSYKDYSRISSSSKSLWSEIFLSNKNNLLENIKIFKKYLTELETALSKNAKSKTINTIKPKRRKP